MVYAL
jgi:hypothetical protein